MVGPGYNLRGMNARPPHEPGPDRDDQADEVTPDAGMNATADAHGQASGEPQSPEPESPEDSARTGRNDVPLDPDEVVIHMDRRSFAASRLLDSDGPLTRFFRTLSKTDEDIIALCSDSARKTQTSIGILIFCTGILAFLSGGYAVYTSFRSLTFAALAGFFYSVIIMIFNREIVSTSSRRMLAVRMIFAVFLGYIVAVPLELRFFEDTIRAEIESRNRVRNEEIYAQRDATEKEYDGRVQAALADIKFLRTDLETLERNYTENVNAQSRDFAERRRALQERIDAFSQKEFEYGRAMEQETVGMVAEGRTGHRGQGLAYREAERQKNMAGEIVRAAKAELEALEQEAAASRTSREDSPDTQAFRARRTQLNESVAKREAELVQLRADLEGKRKELESRYQRVVVTYDLLASYETMHVLTANSNGALLISLAIKLVIILLEMIPVIVKFCVANNEYFSTVHHEREIFVAQIEAAARRNLEEIETEPYALPIRGVRDMLSLIASRIR